MIVSIEPENYGMTGRHITSHTRSEFWSWEFEALDAPEYIPRGSARGVLLKSDSITPEDVHYISTTDLRPGAL